MKYFFSSDYHFNHANIIKYENRPFKNVDEMNNTIIHKHNERVKSEDILYFMGDWGFYASKDRAFRGEGMPIKIDELKNQMNGTIISVAGNHDRKNNKLNIPTKRIVLNKGGMYINLIHRPTDTVIYDYQYYYPLTVCGHVHGKWQTHEIEENGIPALLINVAVETNNYYPYEFNEIMNVYWRWLNAHPKKKEIQTLIHKSNHRKDYSRK